MWAAAVIRDPLEPDYAGPGHENGVAEQAHRRLKSLVAQALLVRGHAAFDDVAGYDAFVQEVVAYWRNRPAAARLAEERPALAPCRRPRFPATRAITRSSGGGARSASRIARTRCPPS